MPTQAPPRSTIGPATIAVGLLVVLVLGVAFGGPGSSADDAARPQATPTSDDEVTVRFRVHIVNTPGTRSSGFWATPGVRGEVTVRVGRADSRPHTFTHWGDKADDPLQHNDLEWEEIRTARVGEGVRVTATFEGLDRLDPMPLITCDIQVKDRPTSYVPLAQGTITEPSQKLCIAQGIVPAV